MLASSQACLHTKDRVNPHGHAKTKDHAFTVLMGHPSVASCKPAEYHMLHHWLICFWRCQEAASLRF